MKQKIQANDGDMTAGGWCLLNLPSAVRVQFSKEPLVSDCLVHSPGRIVHFQNQIIKVFSKMTPCQIQPFSKCLLTAILLYIAILAAQAIQAADVILIADFEGTNYGAWTVTGDAFGPGPSQGTLPGQMSVTGFAGQRLVNSFHGGDKSTGTLTSHKSKIEQKFIGFAATRTAI